MKLTSTTSEGIGSGLCPMMKDIICLDGAMPYVEQSVLTFDHLPAGLEGKKLLFAADMHFGGRMNDRRMGRIIELMMSLKPDIVMLGGDYADDISNETAFCERHLPKIKAPLGVYCVPGNNDWEAVGGHYDKLRHMFRKAGVTLLVNEYVYRDIGSGNLVVSGIDDCKRGKPSKSALRHSYEDTDFNVLLSHSPSSVDRTLAGTNARVQLVLCGHTHGGQLRLGRLSPFTIGFEINLNYKRKYFFVNGEHDIDGMKIIVTNGIGCSILPIRIGAPPQIHLYTLSRRQACSHRD